MSDQYDGDVFLDCDMDFITSDMDVTILASIVCPTVLMPILGRTAKVFVKVLNMRMSMRVRVRIRPKEKLVFIGKRNTSMRLAILQISSIFPILIQFAHENRAAFQGLSNHHKHNLA